MKIVTIGRKMDILQDAVSYKVSYKMLNVKYIIAPLLYIQFSMKCTHSS